jgi:hypothetical protein
MSNNKDGVEVLKEHFSLKKVLQAYLSCRRNKRNTINQIKFEVNLEENIYIFYGKT